MTKIIQEQITKPNKLFWILAVLCGFMFCSYLYSIVRITVTVRENTVLSDKLSSLNQDVSNLDYQYLQAKNSITMQTAQSMGFVENSSQLFVSRTQDVPSLSLKTNEI